MIPKFLLIDDDEDDRVLFCEALHEIDPQITCYTAPGGRKAVENMAKREIELPDIIFLDINMPSLSGWQCLSILKHGEEYKHIPVVMYSTTSHPEDIEKAQSNGALCFFTKPSRFIDLKKSMELVVYYLTNGSLSALINSSPLFATTPATQLTQNDE